MIAAALGVRSFKLRLHWPVRTFCAGLLSAFVVVGVCAGAKAMPRLLTLNAVGVETEPLSIFVAKYVPICNFASEVPHGELPCDAIGTSSGYASGYRLSIHVYDRTVVQFALERPLNSGIIAVASGEFRLHFLRYILVRIRTDGNATDVAYTVSDSGNFIWTSTTESHIAYIHAAPFGLERQICGSLRGVCGNEGRAGGVLGGDSRSVGGVIALVQDVVLVEYPAGGHEYEQRVSPLRIVPVLSSPFSCFRLVACSIL